ncbi:substrate-binding domain-containing protein [Bradyrhizobium sp. SSUT112]|uniref:molybdate ABC transporter substrate-binding protein n=1 Tax=Bradyrhizobium sp. SSUT112 TaxID=3040604 RepID=UPI0024473F44|nr:substrate-binding domain-containing protein [Bradyrhizobium sp. SSUT112]MDH2357629.1 substrate-binding domain-containing protein [Bradyrhizobium sp. SSUT112]
MRSTASSGRSPQWQTSCARGAPADLVVLTQALLAKLAEERLVIPTSIADVGRVETALAVRSRDPRVTVKTEAELRDVLRAADAIFVPDIKASTAGRHVAKVLDQLGIGYELASRLRIFPDGATAMRELAASSGQRPIGCTQATEIIATDGVALSGPLPPGYELVTMYTAGITTHATHPGEARALIALLAGADQRQLRRRVGFAG